MRRAITLLEVLISMFIMTVGLLSVASLVPLGKVEQGRGDKTVRASACGRAAFRDMKIRGMMNPRSWAIGNTTEATDNSVFDATAGTFRVSARKFDPLNPKTLTVAHGTFGGIVPVVIDPLGVSNHFGPWFPFAAETIDLTAITPLAPPNPPAAPYLPRLTLSPYSAGNPITNDARKAFAEAVFNCPDDLVFDAPANDDALPSQKMELSGTTPIKRLSEGNYNWLATIVPVASSWDSAPCRVSVAVFHKRSLTIPGNGERICNLASLTGNGEIEISVDPVASTTKVGVAAQYRGDGEGVSHIDVRPQQWVMVAGWNDLDGQPTPTDRVWQFRWYRVTNVDATMDTNGKEASRKSTGTGPWTKRLTIAGADWNIPAPVMSDFIRDARVYLIDGIANVYEKDMTLSSY